MNLLRYLPATTVYAHCDLPCGVYDPAQARIEAESVLQIAKKYAANDDPVFRMRAIMIKEQRAELAKHHLWVSVDGLLQARAPREASGSSRLVLARHQAGRGGQAFGRPGEPPKSFSS
jgi:hypothetical protein